VGAWIGFVLDNMSNLDGCRMAACCSVNAGICEQIAVYLYFDIACNVGRHGQSIGITDQTWNFRIS